MEGRARVNDDRATAAMAAVLTDVIRKTIRQELRSERRSVMTPREIAHRYHLREQVVRDAAEHGLVKVAERKPRNGGRTFMIDVVDAARVWGAS